MSKKKVWSSRIIIVILPVLAGVTFARATPDEAPCALVMKAGKGVQVIPKQGAVLSHLVEEAPVACSAMVITHQDPFWLKLSDQTVIKVAPHSFVEIPKLDSKTFRLYRGQVFVSAPPGILTQTWSTPNSESIFKGGIAYIQYQADTRVSTVSCFNREIQFRNKFNETASTTVRVGEMSHLAIQEASVTPSTPAVMNHASVVQALANLKMAPTDQEELVSIVKRVYQDRAKSLTTEIEDWESEPEAVVPSRAIASVPGAPKSQKAIDAKEASFVKHMMHDHLFGSEADQNLVDPIRKPASVAPDAEFQDTEKQKSTQNLKNETKRLEKEIGQIKDDE